LLESYHKENIESMISELTGIKDTAISFVHMQDLEPILKRTEEQKPQEEK